MRKWVIFLYTDEEQRESSTELNKINLFNQK